MGKAAKSQIGTLGRFKCIFENIWEGKTHEADDNHDPTLLLSANHKAQNHGCRQSVLWRKVGGSIHSSLNPSSMEATRTRMKHGKISNSKVQVALLCTIHFNETLQ